MAIEGSRRDPFSMNQFNSLVNYGHWLGGWVTHVEGLIYHSQDLNTCSCDGSRNNPIPNLFYNEMLERGIWLGGWVSFGAIMYCDKYGVQYDSCIGEENCPCSMSIYYEMVSNGIWRGGWIQESDGSKRYVRNFPVELVSGDGCGCGSCGCGCGCGCGSGSGSDGGCGGCGIGSIEPIMICPIISGEEEYAGVISLPGLGASIDVKISWSEGGTSGLYNLSEANIELTLKDYRYVFTYNNIITRWDNAYTLGIRGNFGVQYLENTPVGYAISASYTIPPLYYKTKEL